MNISIQSLSKAFGSRELLRDFSLEVEPGVRLAVAGPNGAGKSTFLRMVAGLEDPDGGRVILPTGARLGYTAQELDDRDLESDLMSFVMHGLPDLGKFWEEWDKAAHAGDQAALERLGRRQAEIEQSYGYNPEHQARRTLTGLGFSEEDQARPLKALSGGWRERAKLARVLTAGADVLLLDEPTNHLDLEAVEWLESFLTDYRGALCFVAHDRVFLDRIATHVLVLGGLKPAYRKGSFSEFLAWNQEMEEQKRRIAKQIADERDRQMEFVERFKAKASKARQAGSKKKIAHKLEKKLSTIEFEPERKVLDFAWPEPERAEKIVLSVMGLSFAFPGCAPLWPPLDFTLYRGQKVALAGPNGCGKSTLLKLVTGSLALGAGRVVLGGKTRLAYFSQHQAEVIRPENTVLSEMRRLCDPRLTEEQLMGALGLFQLGAGWFERKAGELSGGEKSRLALASLFMARANFLVLDEPTNHLDLESREALVQALEEFTGTVLLVAHDRWLLSSVAEQVWALSGQGIHVHEDGFEGYDQARREAACAPSRAGTVRGRDVAREEKRRQAEQRNALYRKLKPKQEAYAAREKELEKLLERQSELERTLADPDIYADQDRFAKLAREFKECQDEGEAMLEEMAVLEAEIGELEEDRNSVGC